MRSSYIRIHSFYKTTDFIVVRLRFDEEGIRYFVENELMMQAEPNISFTGEGMPLKVHPDDVDKATQLLIEGKIILPPKEGGENPGVLDQIAFNLGNESSRTRTIMVLAIGLGLIIALLSYLLLTFG